MHVLIKYFTRDKPRGIRFIHELCISKIMLTDNRSFFSVGFEPLSPYIVAGCGNHNTVTEDNHVGNMAIKEVILVSRCVPLGNFSYK